MTKKEREELIEKIAKALYEREYDKDHYPWEKEEYKTPYLGDTRAALAVAEPVIREHCAKKCEGDFDSEMKRYGAYFAAAIRDSRNCVPEGGEVENQTKLD